MSRETKVKIIKICLTVTFIVAILFTISIIVITYQVEGEKNLPFEISKIVIISSSEGRENEDSQNRWNLDINQNNDIYIYINKNKNYGKTEIIKNIRLNNFNIEKTSELGETNIYMPVEDGIAMFNNSEQNKVNEMTYTGEQESNIKNLQISNQGGLVVFRCSNDNVGKFVSNEGYEINQSSLLKTIEISNEDLELTLKFDITINLVDGKSYKAEAKIELPVGDIVNNDTTSKELTDLKDIAFKRIEN